MRNILFLLLILLPCFLYAQYPNNPRKLRLGYQTTAAGLVHIKSGSPSHTPSADNDAWMVLDTTNNKLYYYDESASAWEDIIDDFVRDTVFTITSVPDTSTIVPLQGDMFVNSTGDTIGVYRGADGWKTISLTNTISITADAGATQQLTDGDFHDLEGGYGIATVNSSGKTTFKSDTSEVVSAFALQDSLSKYKGAQHDPIILLTDYNYDLAPCRAAAEAAYLNFHIIDDTTITGTPTMEVDTGAVLTLSPVAYGSSGTKWESYIGSAFIDDNWDGAYLTVGYRSADGDTTTAQGIIYVNRLACPTEDSTRLTQDSILIYYQDGSEVGRDTIAGAGGGGGGTDDQTASEVDIADSGGYYTGTEVETALQEAGALLFDSVGTNEIAYGSASGITSDASLTRTNNGIEIGSMKVEEGAGSNSIVHGNTAAASTGSNWIAQGVEAGESNTTGNNWIAQGTNAGRDNTTGSSWIAQGPNAGRGNTTGSNWIAQGPNAAIANDGLGEFVAQGTSAAASTTSARFFVAQGSFAAFSNTTGNGWVAQGRTAAAGNTTGSNWIAQGYNAAYYLTDGTTLANFSNSVYIGADTEVGIQDATNETVIGYSTEGNGSNTVTIGNTNVIATYLSEIVTEPHTTANRTTGESGLFGFNSTENLFEGYNGTAWTFFPTMSDGLTTLDANNYSFNIDQSTTGLDGYALRLNETSGEIELAPDSDYQAATAELLESASTSLTATTSWTHITGLSSFNLNDFTATDSTLTYTGTETKKFIVQYDGSIRIVTGGSGPAAFDCLIYENAVQNLQTRSKVQINAGGAETWLQSVSGNIILELETNDVVSIRYSSSTGGPTFTMFYFNLSITEI